jgi:hypothetical protein
LAIWAMAMARVEASISPPTTLMYEGRPGMKKKPTEPTMPIMGSRFISMLSSPSRGISGGVSSLISPSGAVGGWIRGCRLMMTTLTDALILRD